MAKKLTATRKRGIAFLEDAESESRRRGKDSRERLHQVLSAVEKYGFGSALVLPISPTEEPELLEIWKRVGNAVASAADRLEDDLVS